MRVGVAGASGRLGRAIVAAIHTSDDLTLGAAWTHAASAALGMDAGVLAGVGSLGVALERLAAAARASVDVVVDVSLPAGTAVLADAGDGPMVTGVTGLDAAAWDALRRRATRAPVVVADNFSPGVAVLEDLVARAARVLPDYDVEIVEAHHRHKRDAPSGTARRLGEAVAAARGGAWAELAEHGRHGLTGPRVTGRIGVHALRLGDVVGEHEVWLAGPGERVRLGHIATSREVFAQGALRAARWCAGGAEVPPGVWSLRQVLGLDPIRASG